jgi:hypothetical protein
MADKSYKSRMILGDQELRFPIETPDEEIEAIVQRFEAARTSGGKGRGGSTAPGAGGGPDLSGQAASTSTKVVTPYVTGNLPATLKQMGEESTGTEKFGLGLAQSGSRTARGLMIPQALRAAGVPLDPQGDEALDQAAKGTGWQGTVGDLTSSLAQSVGPGVLASRASAVRNFAAANPRIASYVAAPAASAVQTAAMTPGDLEERAKAGGTAAALTLPATFIARQFAQPLKMSEAGQHIKAATGETPPVHVGAESKLVRDVGQFVKDVPVVGTPLLEGEKRVFDSGVKQLWASATPPGKPNLLSAGGEVKAGKLFQDLEQQFDDTYKTLLTGHRIPVNNKDRAAIVNLIDKNLIPEDAAAVHKLITPRFPKGNHIGGESWQELHDIIRQQASRVKEGDTISENVAEVYKKIDKYLITMRNRGVPRNVARQLDETDRAFESRRILETAIALPGGEKGLTPSMLAKALRDRTSDRGLAQGQGTNQQLIYPMAEALGDMGERNTAQALWGLRRLAIPTAAAGLATGSLPMAAVPALGVAGTSVLGAGRRGANVLFGNTGPQKNLARWLRERPQDIPLTAAGIELQSQE